MRAGMAINVTVKLRIIDNWDAAVIGVSIVAMAGVSVDMFAGPEVRVVTAETSGS